MKLNLTLIPTLTLILTVLTLLIPLTPLNPTIWRYFSKYIGLKSVPMIVTMLSSGALITTLYPDLICQLSTTLLSLIMVAYVIGQTIIFFAL